MAAAAASGEVGEEERAPPAPAASSATRQGDDDSEGVGGEEVREMLPQLVDVTAATGAKQGAAALPPSAEVVTSCGLGLLAAVAEAAEEAGVQSEGEEGRATQETAMAPQGTSRPSGGGGGRGGGSVTGAGRAQEVRRSVKYTTGPIRRKRGWDF